MDVKNLFSMEGKKGFITGGAQGIGKTIAQAFAELGADVARRGDSVRICGHGRLGAPARVLDMGNSGTGIRLLAGLLA